ncbi:MAG TPA: YidB family protein [Gemmatimonadaceae bacterium]|jgi:uncharacterized protein YidB (DUF937 family)
MGLLDDAAGMLGDKGSALKAEAEQGGLGQHVTDLVTGHAGGLQGLLQTFREKGLGDLVSSWVSKEKNQPITAEQIQTVLGNAKIQALAAKVGVSTATVATGLASVLPQVIDRMTPDGKVPAAAAPPVQPPRPQA